MTYRAKLQPTNSSNPGCMTFVAGSCPYEWMRVVNMFPGLKDYGYEGRLRMPGSTDLIDAKFIREDDEDSGFALLSYETMPWRQTYVNLRREVFFNEKTPDQRTSKVFAVIKDYQSREVARVQFRTTSKQFNRFNLRYWTARAVTQALRA